MLAQIRTPTGGDSRPISGQGVRIFQFLADRRQLDARVPTFAPGVVVTPRENTRDALLVL
jgi:hypothetical protein